MSKDILWLQVPAAIPQDKRLQSTRLYLSGIKKSSFIFYSLEHDVIIPSYSCNTTKEIIPFPCNYDLSIKKLAFQLNKKIEIINIGTNINFSSLYNVKNFLAQNTLHSSLHAAMNYEQCMRAINIGRQIAQREKLKGSQLFIGGEIGIKNNISTTAMACALLKLTPEALMQSPLMDNANVMQQRLNVHKNQLYCPIEILRRLGDFRIAALVGSYISCAHTGIPLLINNLVSAVAALTAMQLYTDAEKWFLFLSHSKKSVYPILLNALHNKQMRTDLKPAKISSIQLCEYV